MVDPTFSELLECSLPSKTHPKYEEWKNFGLKSIERGQKIVTEINHYMTIRGKNVLDLGCGTGGISIAFKKEGANVIGLDNVSTNQLLIKIAKARAKEEKLDLIFCYGDGQQMPFRERIFDLIVCNDVIEHVTNQEKIAKEISRVLKSDGILYMSSPNKYSLTEIYRDGHYGLFGVVLLPRTLAKIYVTKIRKMEREYSVGHIPTYANLIKIFKKNGMQLDLISNTSIQEKVYNPTQIENENYKKTIIFLTKLGLTKLILFFFSLPWFIPQLIFIGYPNSNKNRKKKLWRAPLKVDR